MPKTTRLQQLRSKARSLKPERGHPVADTVTALTFAVVNVPQAMGHALLAMVNPVLGIYTLMVAVPVGPRPPSSPRCPRSAAFRQFRASCRSWGCLSFR
jgi:hypothetical protein